MLVGSCECQGMLCDRIRCSRRHGHFDSCSRILLLKNNYPLLFSLNVLDLRVRSF